MAALEPAKGEDALAVVMAGESCLFHELEEMLRLRDAPIPDHDKFGIRPADSKELVESRDEGRICADVEQNVRGDDILIREAVPPLAAFAPARAPSVGNVANFSLAIEFEVVSNIRLDFSAIVNVRRVQLEIKRGR